MAQQVVKRYRLKKDLPTAKAGTIYSKSKNGKYYNENEGVAGEHDWLVEHAPDWFEEVKDAPFEIEWVSFNRSYENGVRFIFQSRQQINPDEYRDKVKKAIEDIVNGVDEKDKCLFDADKINARLRELELDQLQREAFFAGRKVNTYDFDYPTYEDYKNSKK